MIGGEACPPALVKRWSRPGRTLLNSYGPTETTVTASLGVMTPERPVTIGRPLPTYSIVILDAKQDRAVDLGEAGEIGIAGVGVAEGYLNRPELTQAKFIGDFLALPNNPSGRIYRTGDLGRINEDGEIEYLGRIDTQIKLRGYRIELTEIESVLLEIPEIAQAVAATFEPEPGAQELVAYYAVKHGSPAPDRGAIVALMRSRLPGYMTPAYLEQLPFIPTLVSNKADRAQLPAPKSARLRFSDTHVAPETPTERTLCRALADTLGLDEVSIDGDLFNDYGAHSLLMARFCARVRQLEPSLQVAMRDVYANATVRRLARALDAARPATLEPEEALPDCRPSNFAYYACGAAQMMVYVAFGALSVAAALAALDWFYDAVDFPLALYGRAFAAAVVWFFGHNGLAVAAKWLLIGRARAESIPLWSFAYFRFWTAKLIVRSAPANAFVGTPLYNTYLRLLGARIGRNAVIASGAVPVDGGPLPGRRRCGRIAKRRHAGLFGLRQSHPYRQDPHRPQRLCRRADRPRHRRLDRRLRPARPRFVPAKRPAHSGRQALPWVPRRGDDDQFPPDGRNVDHAAEALAFRRDAARLRHCHRHGPDRSGRHLRPRGAGRERGLRREQPVGRRPFLGPDGRGRRVCALSDCARRRAGAHLRPASARQPLSGRGPGLPALWLPSRHA